MKSKINLHWKAKNHTHLLTGKEKDKIAETYVCYSIAKDDTAFASPTFSGTCSLRLQQ